ncbi:MAG: LemA family protein [Chloroflexota bacterium]
MPLTAAILFALAVVLVVVLFLVVTTYNDVVALRNRITKAWANVDVALKQRHDELPSLVDAVRGVMSFERGVLAEVTQRRAAYSDRDPIPQQAATSEATTDAVRQLFAVVERYPEVKSAANVASLQEEITRLEDVIADRRELYNDQAYRYNTRIAQLPASLLAGIAGWTPRPFFAADAAAQARPDVEMRAG